MNSVDVVGLILRKNPEIGACRFFRFSAATKLQERVSLFDGQTASLVSEALEFKRARGTAFWFSVLSCLINNAASHRLLLNQALFHQVNRDFIYKDVVDVDHFLAVALSGQIAFNSAVILRSGITRHIPMLDFKVQSKGGNTNLVVDCVKALGLKGYVLDSGRSYHFMGEDLISESELMELMAKFVLFDPVSDKAWAAHQIIERSASLRISARRGVFPEVVASVDLAMD